jgi:hypothetical protein
MVSSSSWYLPRRNSRTCSMRRRCRCRYNFFLFVRETSRAGYRKPEAYWSRGQGDYKRRPCPAAGWPLKTCEAALKSHICSLRQMWGTSALEPVKDGEFPSWAICPMALAGLTLRPQLPMMKVSGASAWGAEVARVCARAVKPGTHENCLSGLFFGD